MLLASGGAAHPSYKGALFEKTAPVVTGPAKTFVYYSFFIRVHPRSSVAKLSYF
jgi:hypothetical protein